MDLRQLKDRALEHTSKRRFDKAAEVYARISLTEPNDLQVRQKLGDALRQSGKPREAVEVYRAVADAYARDGLLLKAIAINKLLLEVEPGHTATQRHLADLYAQRSPRRLREDRGLPVSSFGRVGTASDISIEVDLPAADRPEAPPWVGALERDARDSEVAVRENMSDMADVGPPPEAIQLALEGETEPRIPDPAEEATLARVPESPLFEALDPEAFVDLLQRCQRRTFQAGETLIVQGDPARSFCVLSDGQLKVVQASASDASVTIELARLGPGDFFGELALVSDSPRIASVVAVTDGEALEFPGAVLQQLVASHPAAEAALHRFTRTRLLQNAMATSPLFRPFDRSQRKHLIARFVMREVSPHTAVLVEGQPSDGLYVVMQGRFRVERKSQRLATLGVGDIFGEISLLTQSQAGASVVSEGVGRVLRLPRKAFEELILTHPQVLELVSLLADEREQLNEGVTSGRVSCDTEGLILM